MTPPQGSGPTDSDDGPDGDWPPADFDPIEWLRTHDPLRHLPTDPPPAEDPRARRIFERVISEAGHIRRRRGRALIPIAAAAAALLAAAGVGAAIVASRSADDPTDVVCFSAADLDSNRTLIAAGDDPVDTCADAWADDIYIEVFGDRPTPTLAACTLDSGLAGVFPAEEGDPCAALGLDRLGEPLPTDHAVREFEEAVVDRLLDTCTPATDVERLVLDELTAAGLEGWEVVIDPAPPEPEGCGTVFIEPPDQTVHIVTVPPPPPHD